MLWADGCALKAFWQCLAQTLGGMCDLFLSCACSSPQPRPSSTRTCWTSSRPRSSSTLAATRDRRRPPPRSPRRRPSLARRRRCPARPSPRCATKPQTKTLGARVLLAGTSVHFKLGLTSQSERFLLQRVIADRVSRTAAADSAKPEEQLQQHFRQKL